MKHSIEFNSEELVMISNAIAKAKYNNNIDSLMANRIMTKVNDTLRDDLCLGGDDEQ